MFATPLLPWKSSKYYIFRVHICSLSYKAHNTHAPYCHVWHALLYNIFPHYLINGMTFGKRLLNIKCVFWFFQLLSKTFLILIRIKWDLITNVHQSVFMHSACYSCQILMELQMLTDTKSYSNIKCHEIPFSGSRAVPLAWTDRLTDIPIDRHDEANGRFSQFCKNI